MLIFYKFLSEIRKIYFFQLPFCYLKWALNQIQIPVRIISVHLLYPNANISCENINPNF